MNFLNFFGLNFNVHKISTPQPKAQVAKGLLTCCNNLLQANTKMRSHGSRQLVDDKSVASCQQTCCKLIVKTCYPQACCKLFQQVVTCLPMTSYNKPYFNRRVDEIVRFPTEDMVDEFSQLFPA